SIFQRFIHTGPLPLKKRRQRQFRQRLRLTFTQQGISQVKQRVCSSFEALVEVLTNLLQYGTVHCVHVLCLVFCLAKYCTPLGSLWQAMAAFWCPFSLNFNYMIIRPSCSRQFVGSAIPYEDERGVCGA